jgi:hypothetical protein
MGYIDRDGDLHARLTAFIYKRLVHMVVMSNKVKEKNCHGHHTTNITFFALQMLHYIPHQRLDVFATKQSTKHS